MTGAPTAGGVVSIVTLTLAVPALPAGSSARAVRARGPSPPAMPAAVKAVPCIVASTPFTVTVAEASSTVPVTLTLAWPRICPATGVRISTTGATSSRVKVRLASPAFPARSVALARSVTRPRLTGRSRPKTPSVTLAVTPFTLRLLTASLTVPLTCTGEALTSAPGSGLVNTSRGGRVSRVPPKTTVAALPAASSARRAMVLLPSARSRGWAKLSPARATGWPLSVTRTRGEASETAPLTVTSGWFVRKPSPGAVIAMSGGMVSTRTGTASGWLSLPAWSRALTWMT